MLRNILLFAVTVCLLGSALTVHAADTLSGTYVEARTCQVYTGPCFANGEVGSTGKDAVMSWQISAGSYNGVELNGMGVALVVKASDTLGFKGLENSELTKALLVIDVDANSDQTQALTEFALAQTNFSAEQVIATRRAQMEMDFDMAKLTAKVRIGEFATLDTRKARPSDCICSNESAYYPPLVNLKGFVPGVTLHGDVTARELGRRWSIPDSRSAYLGTFEIKAAHQPQVASRL